MNDFFTYSTRLQLIVFLLFLVSGIGCSTISSTISVTEEVDRVTPEPAIEPQDLVEITPHLSRTPKPTSSHTPNPTETATMLPTSTFTATPTPTLTVNEAQQMSLTMFETNGGCLLPCWWGIVPGQTTWQSAQQFFSSFTEIATFTLTDNAFYGFTQFYVPPENWAGQFQHRYTVENGVVRDIQAHGVLTLTAPLQLPYVLNTYGLPESIWMRSGTIELGSVSLFYPNHGFLILYGTFAETAREGDITTGIVRGCHPQASHVFTWSPDEMLSYFEVTERQSGDNREEIYNRTLEEATGMTVETFYEMFSQEDILLCLETPAYLWNWGSIPPPPTPVR